MTIPITIKEGWKDFIEFCYTSLDSVHPEKELFVKLSA